MTSPTLSQWLRARVFDLATTSVREDPYVKAQAECMATWAREVESLHRALQRAVGYLEPRVRGTGGVGENLLPYLKEALRNNL